MRKRKKSPSYFTLLIPGIFMAILGIGNIVLGTFKYEQYEEVVVDNKLTLSKSRSQVNTHINNLSPLQRLKNTENTSSRMLHLLRKAETRRDLYSLVIYGGKILLILSSLLLIGAIFKKIINDARSPSQGLKSEI